MIPALVTWHLWKRRNVAKFENKKLEPVFIIAEIWQFFSGIFKIELNKIGFMSDGQNWGSLISILENSTHIQRVKLVKWIPPDGYKLNTDGSAKGCQGLLQGEEF